MLSFSGFDGLLLYDLEGLLESSLNADVDNLTGSLVGREDPIQQLILDTSFVADVLDGLDVDQLVFISELGDSLLEEVSDVIQSYLEHTDIFEEQTSLSDLNIPNLTEEVLALQLDPFQDKQTFTNSARARSSSEYDIEIRFTDNNFTSSQRAIFTDAANRWEQIIIGDLPDVFVSGLGQVDDVVIEASAPFIDGVGGILGQAGPEFIRTSSSLPISGTMQFDSADVNQLEAAGRLDEVIVHEMGHVLGIGTIWNRLGLLQGTVSNPRYVGSEAVQEYNDIFGLNASSIPVENRGGPGTAFSHWRESVFDNELMTGFLNFGQENPLSRVTVASLADLGYEVDLSAADSYSPPFASA